MKSSRRNFVRITGAAGAGLITRGLKPLNFSDGLLRIVNPVDGDMLNQTDGPVVNGCLMITVKIQAPSGSKIRVNGIAAKYREDLFQADVPLKEYKNFIEAVDGNSGNKERIEVFWLKNYVNKYRISLDDNIWFLQDISKNSATYKSIFENPYLGFFKKIHDTFGTRVHINIYYQTEGFNLSQMTTKFKNEWRENAGWIRLSFHALQNDPDNPYIKAGYDDVKKDCNMVMEQIRRFAGEELMGPVTTLHWGEATIEGSRALRDAGYIGQVSDFVLQNGVQSISMYLDLPQSKHINERFIWRDNREGIIFSKVSIILNSHKVEEIVPVLEKLKENPHKSGYMDLLMHEQYFYPFYINYQPDYREKITTAVKWATEKGYKPAFLSECIFA